MNPNYSTDNNAVQYLIGKDSVGQSAKYFTAYPSVYILIDENTEKFCLPILQKNLPNLKVRGYIKVPSGESEKTLERASFIWKKLTNLDAGRDSLLINLGGGVITDMGGFCAGTFKRGIDFINIPTTLLAQVDAAIGGKTGINFNSIKNQIGLFYDPKAVIVDPVFLNTLDEKYWQSGFAEILKYALIMDRELWKMLNMRKYSEIDDWNKIIERSAKDKIDIVRYDKMEKGIRKNLNFGHTVGLAFESLFLKSGKSITHGRAIAAGMICEAWISSRMTELECINVDEIIKMIDNNFERLSVSEKNINELMEIMRQDKKIRDGLFRFSLLRRMGKAVHDIVVEPELVEQSLRFYIDNKNCK